MDLGNAETVDPSQTPAELAGGAISAARAQYVWGGQTPRLESLLAQVAEQSASAVSLTDARGVIVWVNEGFSRITGYSFDEAVGRVPGQLLQGDATDRAEAARVGAALRSKQGVSSELINYTKDGRQYWVGIKIVPLVNAAGEVDAFMGTSADITERRARSEALELLTTRFDMATRAAHIGIFDLDARSGEVWWSRIVWEIFGIVPGSIRSTWAIWQTFVHPEDLARMSEFCEERHVREECALGEERENVLQYRILRPDGSVRHIQSIAAPLNRENRIAGVLLDVTARVESEERERELQRQLRESSHRAGMAEIATGVLHNVGNVLNSLGIANGTARRTLKALQFDRLAQACELLRSNGSTLAAFLTEDARGRHLPNYLGALSTAMALQGTAVQAELDTVDQLLHHLRNIVTAQQSMAQVGGQLEPIDLRELLESALLVQAAGLAHIEVVRSLEALPPVSTNRHKLLQILVNLVSNACDAVRANTERKPRIVVRLARDGSDALIAIEDSGVGMSAEVLTRLWRFGFTTKPEGHGFGLHNSANAAQEIGATIDAYSDGPGQGARFVLRMALPAEYLDMAGTGA